MRESSKVREISLGDDFGDVAIRANSARVDIHPDRSVDVYTDGPVRLHSPANDAREDVPSATSLLGGSWTQKVREVGDRLRDGTVCIAVDLNRGEALFAPAGIFGGKAPFDDQNEIPAQLNNQCAHGYSDWRNITDEEGKTLSQGWDKVAPDELKGPAAPRFWLASSYDYSTGRVRRGGELRWSSNYRNDSLPVPCVRSGPVSI